MLNEVNNRIIMWKEIQIQEYKQTVYVKIR